MPVPKPRGSRPRPRRSSALAPFLGMAAVILLLSGGALWLLGGPARPAVGGPWVLTRDDGQRVSDVDFRGRYLLIYFGYTACPDICPTTMTAVADAMQRLGPQAARIQPLFISIDPDRDTPPVLRDYLAHFGPGLVGLTGTRAELRAAEQEFHVRSVIHADAAGTALIDHSTVLLLIGPDGRYMAPLPADLDAATMATRLSRVIS